MPEALTAEERNFRDYLWTSGKSLVQAAPQLYIDTDIEADGIAGWGSITALGSKSPFGEEFYSEIKPTSENFIPRQREFCENHGLERERLLREAPDFIGVMRRYQEWVLSLQRRYKKDSTVMVVANGSFDFSHIDLYFYLACLDNPFGTAPFDVKSLALPLSRNWSWSDTSIGKMPRIILPDGEFTHHALEDARYQQKVHFGLAALLKEVPRLRRFPTTLP